MCSGAEEYVIESRYTSKPCVPSTPSEPSHPLLQLLLDSSYPVHNPCVSIGHRFHTPCVSSMTQMVPSSCASTEESPDLQSKFNQKKVSLVTVLEGLIL